MYGPDDSTAVAERPAPSAAGTMGWFSPGNPAAGELPSELEPDFLNGLLAELLSILAAAGITPNKAQSAQLLAAILKVTSQALAGGAYHGINSWATTQTLAAAQACGWLNLLFTSGIALTLPLAGSVAAGTPIDFGLAVSGTGMLNAQGGDSIFVDFAAAAFYGLTSGGRIRLVSDGISAWHIDIESNLRAPKFRDVARGQTQPRADASDALATTAFAKAVGLRTNGFVSQAVPTLGINSGVIGAYLNNTYPGAIWYLPDLASTELYGCFTVYASAGLTLQRSGSDGIVSRGGIYPSVQLLPGQTAVVMVGPDYWRFIMDPNVQDAGLGVIGKPQTIGDGYGYLDFTLAAGAYRDLALIVEGSSNAGHAGAGLCFGDASGALSSAVGFLLSNLADTNPFTIFGTAKIEGLDLNHSLITAVSSFATQASPFVTSSAGFGGSGGAVAVRHTGGLTLIRVLASTGSLTAGTYTLLGR